MPKTPYQKKLMDPRWQKMRLYILDRDMFQCQHCLATDKTLHVHHKYYNASDPWEYPESALITLCYECHYDEGDMLEANSKILIESVKKSGAMAQEMAAIIDGFDNVNNEYFGTDLYRIVAELLKNKDYQRLVFDAINQ